MSDANQTEDNKPAAQPAEREPETDMTAAEEVGFLARRIKERCKRKSFVSL